MAAVLPFRERQDDPAETEDIDEVLAVPAAESNAMANIEDDGVTLDALAGLQGLDGIGYVEDFPIHDVDREDYDKMLKALQSSHSELVRTSYLREAVVQTALQREFTLRIGKPSLTGKAALEVFFWLDEPIGTDPRWNPAGTGNAAFFQMLTWTSKMGCPSFSLPAGPTTANGSCPGANASQTIVPLKNMRTAARRVEEIVGHPVRLQQAVCQYCYAEGGRYGTSLIQFGQTLNYIWTRMRHEHEDWFDTMRYAIEFTDYVLDGGTKKNQTYRPEATDGRFFRIHDSGDFFARTYVEAWDRLAYWFSEENNAVRAEHLRSEYGLSAQEIAANHAAITFWSPTRCYATSWGQKAVNAIRSPNLIVRASAYHTNEAAPGPRELGDGWASGSVVYHLDAKDTMPQGYWDCPAYRVESETESCRNAVRPDGGTGCRACWLYPKIVINYTLH